MATSLRERILRLLGFEDRRKHRRSRRLLTSALLEERLVPTLSSVEQFLMGASTLTSDLPADFNAPIISIYSDKNAGPDYFGTVQTGGFTFEGNDPDAAAGWSSWRSTLISSSAWFEFKVLGNMPDASADVGLAHMVRFYAKGDSAGQQVRVKVLRTPDGVSFSDAASADYTLTTTWQDFALALPSDMKPAELWSIQFMTGPAYQLNWA